jgi:hypothetical protein
MSTGRVPAFFCCGCVITSFMVQNVKAVGRIARFGWAVPTSSWFAMFYQYSGLFSASTQDDWPVIG